MEFRNMDMNSKKLNEKFYIAGNEFSMSNADFSIGVCYPSDAVNPRRKDMSVINYFTLSPSGNPLYFRESDAEDFTLVDSLDQVARIIEAHPEIRYNNIIHPLKKS